MSITCGFFNSVNGDRTYNADDLNNFFNGLLDEGVFKNYNSGLEVVAHGGDMSVDVLGGKACILGKFVRNTSTFNLPVEVPIYGTRTDSVVVAVDLLERTASMYIKPGSTHPIISDTYKEIILATITVSAQDYEITSYDITDTRANENLCGWVKLTNLQPKQVVFTSQQEVAANVDTVYFNYEAYDPSVDTVEVYLNGLRLYEGVDYDLLSGYVGINGHITLRNRLNGYLSGNMITFVISRVSYDD